MINDIFIPPKRTKLSRKADPRPGVLMAQGLCAAFLLLLSASLVGCGGSDHRTQSASTTPGFSISANPSALQVPAGGSGYAVVSVSRVNGFSGDISLSMAGLPAGVVASGTIPDGAASGRLIIAVAGAVAPQSLGNLTLDGQAGTLQRTAGFSLVVGSPLPPSNLSPDLVNASGGAQQNGATTNTALAMEPVTHDLSSDNSGATEVRHGFLPVPSPSVP
jgi:hypothetical protein